MLIVRSCAAWNATTANVLPHRGNPSMQISVWPVTSSPLRRTSRRDRVGHRPATVLASQAARRAGISRAPILTPLYWGCSVRAWSPWRHDIRTLRPAFGVDRAGARERLLVEERHRELAKLAQGVLAGLAQPTWGRLTAAGAVDLATGLGSGADRDRAWLTLLRSARRHRVLEAL